MIALQQPPAPSAPDFAGTLRRRLEGYANKETSVDTGIDASSLGKFLGGGGALKLEDVAKLMSKAGLKAVDQRRICQLPEEVAMHRRAYALILDHAPWLLNEVES